MRRIITWSVRGKHPWIVIAAWIVVAGLLSMGPKIQSVTTNDASKGLSDKVESKRADALYQASFPNAKGTPVIVVYSSDAALTAAQKAAVTARQGLDARRRGAGQLRQRPVLGRRQGGAALRQPRRQSGRRGLPRLGAGHPRPLRRDGRGHAGARHRPRRAHHRRLQDLPERRREAARRHGHPRARAAAGHLPLAGAAVRAARRRGLRLLRRRRHPGAARQGARTSRSRGRRRRSWSSCCSAPAPTTACCSSRATARTCAAPPTRGRRWPRRSARPGRRSRRAGSR